MFYPSFFIGPRAMHGQFRHPDRKRDIWLRRQFKWPAIGAGDYQYAIFSQRMPERRPVRNS